MPKRVIRRIRLILKSMGFGIDPGDWLVPDRLLGCGYPKTDRALQALQDQGVSVLVNLHERDHDPATLEPYGLTSVHIPIIDFSAPTPEQIEEALTAIDDAHAKGQRVAVHCGAGLGRTGTVLACYLVAHGADSRQAIHEVRQLRPGSIETGEQAEAVRAFATRRAKS
jgi:atypical dual specificity phosphatase